MRTITAALWLCLILFSCSDDKKEVLREYSEVKLAIKDANEQLYICLNHFAKINSTPTNHLDSSIDTAKVRLSLDSLSIFTDSAIAQLKRIKTSDTKINFVGKALLYQELSKEMSDKYLKKMLTLVSNKTITQYNHLLHECQPFALKLDESERAYTEAIQELKKVHHIETLKLN